MGIRGINDSNIVDMNIPAVASAASITVSGNKMRITGNTTIDTILQPLANPYFQGPVYIFNTDAAVGTISTNGNVALGVTLTRFKLFQLIWDGTTSKWYPSSAS